MVDDKLSPVTFLQAVWRLLAPQRGRVLVGILLVMVTVSFIVGLPLYYRVMIDDAVVAINLDLLTWMLFWLGLAYLINSTAAILQSQVYAHLSSSLASELREQMYQKVQTLHDGSQNSADVATHFGADLGALEKWLAQPARIMLIHGSVLATSALLLLWVEWRLALFTYAIIPIILLAMKLLSAPTLKHGAAKKQTVSGMAGFITEEVRANIMIRLFGLGARRGQQFGEQVEQLREQERKAAFWSSLTGETSIILINLIQIGVFGLGAYFTLTGKITLGVLVAYAGLMINISNAGITLSQLFPQLFDAAGAYARVLNFLAQEQAQTAARGEQHLTRLETIEIDKVDFAYTPGQDILKQVSLSVQQGEHIALVGSSGSGKSTLLRVIMGLEQYHKGDVRFNDISLNDLGETSLHRHMAAVFQQPLLLDGSIKENILVGNPDADEAAVHRAAQQAEIDQIIEKLTQGYDTPVGEAGGKLSGGQQQRIAIARALIREPDLLLLDEATSALDAATEQSLIETLQRVTEDCTVIAVTHRLALAAAMERIIVLEAGRIVEDGSHEQLLQQNGSYAHLWRKQHLAHMQDDGNTVLDKDALVSLPPLQALQLDKHLSSEALQQLSGRFRQESYPAGVTIIRQGELPDGFRVIARGQVEVVREQEEQKERLAILEEGDYFGEGALLQDTTRMASVHTVTPTVCLTLSSAEFRAILQDSPALREQLDELFQQRLEQT